MSIDQRSEYLERYPAMPDRIIDNLLEPKARVSVVQWATIVNDPETLRFLISATADERASCEYDLRREMRRINS